MEKGIIVFEIRKVILIDASTGCSCCSYENHYRGPYKSIEDAERRIKYYRSPDSKYWPLASQYARRGVYRIETHTIEMLPDGRIIWLDRVYDKDELNLTIVEVNESGETPDNEKERFCTGGERI